MKSDYPYLGQGRIKNWYSLTFLFDNGDPNVYGPYKSEEEAEESAYKIARKMDEREWYHCANAGGWHISLVKKGI